MLFPFPLLSKKDANTIGMEEDGTAKHIALKKEIPKTGVWINREMTVTLDIQAGFSLPSLRVCQGNQTTKESMSDITYRYINMKLASEDTHTTRLEEQLFKLLYHKLGLGLYLNNRISA